MAVREREGAAAGRTGHSDRSARTYLRPSNAAPGKDPEGLRTEALTDPHTPMSTAAEGVNQCPHPADGTNRRARPALERYSAGKRWGSGTGSPGRSLDHRTLTEKPDTKAPCDPVHTERTRNALDSKPDREQRGVMPTGMGPLVGGGNVLALGSGDGVQHGGGRGAVLNATGACTSKCVKWQIMCVFHFNQKNKAQEARTKIHTINRDMHSVALPHVVPPWLSPLWF